MISIIISTILSLSGITTDALLKEIPQEQINIIIEDDYQI